LKLRVQLIDEEELQLERRSVNWKGDMKNLLRRYMEIEN
jgi:hypothetical protein